MILFLRYIFITITFVSLFLVGFTQPANNDCSNATNLGTLTNTNQLCANGETNVNATPDIPYITLKNCDGNGGDLASPAQDVWYKFKVDSGEQLLVEITGALANPQIALWEGSCGQLIGRGCATGAASA
ncbi:MAG: hypothetical protein JKX95_01300, partial [Bacteroidia bacterium]|nr:hypothetical protein [Bacteroidia bacterium]